jgi:hypothetical protein
MYCLEGRNTKRRFLMEAMGFSEGTSGRVWAVSGMIAERHSEFTD